MINQAEGRHVTRASGDIRVPTSDAALVRDTPSGEDGQRTLFPASLKQLRRLRSEALRVASKARQKMTESLLVSESYTRAALKLKHRACDCEAEVAAHSNGPAPLANEYEHCRELRSLAENLSHRAGENAHRANDLSEEITLQNAEAARIRAEIGRRLSAHTIGAPP